ncbi:MAG: PEGA domain-containing protein, partial [Methanosarcinaceae archaeon]|nr:PEGA domain-containing protein [Methanosarcinaceae archaeon]
SVSAGSHIVKLTKSGYVDKDVNINVVANEQTVVSETLSATPQQPTTGSLSISSSPSSATVYLDGALQQGTTPLTLASVSAGSHIVKLTKSGYVDKEVNINVIAGQGNVVSETLSAVPQTVSGEGYIISKNSDFTTNDREFSSSGMIYVKVWSDRVDYTDMNRMYFEIRDVTSSITLVNNNDGTFTGSYDLSRTSRTGEREVRIRLRDNRDREYRADTRITISSSSYSR